VLAGQPRLDPVAGEVLDRVGRGDASDQLAMVAEGGEQHVRPDGGHHHGFVERSIDVEHAGTGRAGGLQSGEVRELGTADAVDRLLGRAGADQVAQAADQLGRVELLHAVRLDRFDRLRERVEAGQHRGDGIFGEAAGALTEQLEHILHLMRELGDRGEAHRGAHPLEGVRDPEDPVDGVAVGRVVLQLHDRDVQFLQMLPRLGEEHGHVLGGVHHAFR
jgi:hypothetical protein